MNLDYEKIYRVYMKIPWYLKNDIAGIGTGLFIRQFDERFNQELTDIFKQKFPKKKKIDLNLLDTETIEPVKERYQSIVVAAYKSKIKQIDLLRKLLNQVAETTLVGSSKDNEMHMVKSSSASTYSSQGWGANRYAKNALNSDYEMLKRCNYTVEIRQSLAWDDPKCDWYNYQLWANLEDWQFDCLLRQESLDELELAISLCEKGLNPAVYNPWISREIFDKSMDLCNTKRLNKLVEHTKIAVD
jgi:hypothetical protein